VETATKGGKKADNLLAKHVDPPHALGLLPTRREWPRGRRTAEQRDELAALQLIELHSIPVLATILRDGIFQSETI
jgi:hypothetical protein